MKFEVRALNGSQSIVSLSLEAPDRASAMAQAQAQGLAVLSTRPRRAWGALLPGSQRRFPVLQFSQELVALLGAGLSLPETLDVMVEKESRFDARKALEAIRSPLMEGRSFSQALQENTGVFSPLFVATVRASERTGDLAEALSRYNDYHERIELVRKKIVSATIYPAVLLAVGGLVVLFLLGYVVPRFSSIYAESGRELPWMSQLLLDWGTLMNAHGALTLTVLVGGGALALLFVTQLMGVMRAAVMCIPAVGERVLMYHLARLYRTLGMLLRGGTPIVPAIELVTGLLPADLRPRLALAAARIREGSPISLAMGEAQLTTAVAARMLRVGESSGDMAAMMDRIAAFHDEELARWVEWFVKLFEPLLMALIGVVVGGIVVLMYLPIFDLAASLQ